MLVEISLGRRSLAGAYPGHQPTSSYDAQTNNTSNEKRVGRGRAVAVLSLINVSPTVTFTVTFNHPPPDRGGQKRGGGPLRAVVAGAGAVLENLPGFVEGVA